MIRSRIKSSLQVIVPWLLFFVIDLIKKPKQDFSDIYFLWYYLPGYLLWILFTIPAFKIFKWSGRLSLIKRGAFLISLGIMIGFSKVILNRIVFVGSGVLFDQIPMNFSLRQLVGGSFFLAEATIIAWVMIIIFYVIEISQKYQEKSMETSRLEADLMQANLQALKMQIRPHFLFNAHNAIATLMRANRNEEALEMLLKLSDLLRISLRNFNNQFITLDQEVDFAKKYLDVEAVRFEDRLKVEFEMNQADRNLKVPVFILQPLIENGIVHGVSKTLGPSVIKISVNSHGRQVLIKVFSTGVLNNNGRGLGIGLSNVKSRLQTLFQEQASLDLAEVEGGVEVALILPYLEEKPQEYANTDH